MRIVMEIEYTDFTGEDKNELLITMQKSLGLKTTELLKGPRGNCVRPASFL
jgi:hypothetical protein